jgi:hypothetical protein
MMIDIRSGVVFCSAEHSGNDGILTAISFSIPEARLIAEANADGRYTWDNEDVIRIASELLRNQIS